MFQRLLVCTDLTDGLHRLSQLVPDLAASGIQQLGFLHCVPIGQDYGIPKEDTQEIETARERLRAALQTVPTGVDVQVRVESGEATDTILRIAQELQSDLIVLGTPPRSLLSEKLIGSTLMQVCQRSSSALMNLRPQLMATYTSEELALRCRHLFRWLMIPYDDSDAAKSVIAQVKRYVQHNPNHAIQQIQLCTAVDCLRQRSLPEAYQLEAAQNALEAAQAELQSLGLLVKAELRQGEPVSEILAAAQTHEVSAIVVAADHRHRLLQLSAPSFATELLRRSWHPLIYLPAKK